MQEDGVIARGYTVDQLAGTGGMGSVYKGRDRDGNPVAIKVLKPDMAHLQEHFVREAHLLCELDHPAIVRYIDSGTTEGGQPFLVMEWLPGQDLRTRLDSENLRVRDSLHLVARIADALDYTHRHGVVHRDIKPSNVFLVDGQVDQVKLLDFGIARWGRMQADGGQAASRAGTPAYMAPEQVRGSRGITTAADVFALGCVLFECLTGEPTFVAHHHMAALCKILMDDPPRASDVAMGIPRLIDDMLVRMLAARPGERPSGAEVVRELDQLTQSLQSLHLEIRPAANEPPRTITEAEQRVVHAVMAIVGARPFDPGDEPTVWSGEANQSVAESDPATPPASPRGFTGLTAELSAFHHLDAGLIVQIEALAAQLRSVGARFSVLGDGSLVAVMDTRAHSSASYQTAVDHAIESARCALRLHQVFPHAAVAIASGRAVKKQQRLVGAVIDNAMAMLEGARVAHLHTDTGTGTDTATGVIRIDSLSAALIGSRFQIAERDDQGLALQSERRELASRHLLGRPTPFVGRDEELQTLTAALDACIANSAASAVLVVGEPGFGKSRLCEEFLLRAEDHDEEPEVWLARGEPMRGGTSLHLMADGLRNVAGISDSEPDHVRWRKLCARVARYARIEQRARIVAFASQLLELTPHEDDLELRAARRDPVRMGDQIRRACVDLLDAETRDHPVLFVIEDLHWGDRATVELLDRVLGALAHRPFMVLALARPEVRDAFPGLWREHRVTEIQLGRLARPAAQEFVYAALGRDADADRVARLIDLSDGNTFFLEELVRSAASKDPQSPDIGAIGAGETVKAMVHARLGGLGAPTRRVLRAASVFGKLFWRGGVNALVDDGAVVNEGLAELMDCELISLSPTSRFKRDTEYQFHHAMIRDVAYEMLTEDDRRLGHRLAGAWLHAAGELDARALAEHFALGGDAALAAPHYVRAAADALDRGDFDAAVALAERGIACGASGELLGALRRVLAIEQVWRGDPAQVASLGASAMQLLPVGSRQWHEMAAETGLAWGKIGEVARTEALARQLLEMKAGDDPTGRLVALAKVCQQMLVSGLGQVAESLLDATLREDGGTEDADLIAAPDLHLALALRSAVASDSDPAELLVGLERCAAGFEAIGDLRQACLHGMNVGYAQLHMGLYEHAEIALRAALDVADKFGLPAVAQGARRNLALVLGRLARPDEAIQMGTRAVEWFAVTDDRRMTALSRLYLAEVMQSMDELDSAVDQIDRALALLDEEPPTRAFALAMRAQAALARDRVSLALEFAQQAFTLLESGIGMDEGAALVRLVYAQALRAGGEPDAAHSIIERAREVLLGRAGKIGRTDWRESFLQNVEVHARTLQLAQNWTQDH